MKIYIIVIITFGFLSLSGCGNSTPNKIPEEFPKNKYPK
jgi:hypothetical protein